MEQQINYLKQEVQVLSEIVTDMYNTYLSDKSEINKLINRTNSVCRDLRQTIEILGEKYESLQAS